MGLDVLSISSMLRSWRRLSLMILNRGVNESSLSRPTNDIKLFEPSKVKLHFLWITLSFEPCNIINASYRRWGLKILLKID